MTKEELVSLIEDGSDIVFEVNDKSFTILTWTEGGISIAEGYKPETEKKYKIATDLVSEYIIDGTNTLASFANDVRIVEYS